MSTKEKEEAVEKNEAVLDEGEELSYDELFDEAAGEEPAAAEKAPAKKDPDEAAGESATEQGKETQDSKDEGNDDPYNWIEALPKEFRDKAKALADEKEKTKHFADSQTGRIRSIQAQLDEERRAREAAAKLAASQREQANKAPSLPKAKEELAKKVAKIKEEYPDLADAIDTMASFHRAEMEETFEQRLRPVQEDTKKRQYESNRRIFEEKAAAILDTANTGVSYQEVFSSEEYAAFLDNQPAYIRDKAQTSTDPDEAASILELFVKDQRIKQLEEQANKKSTPTQERKKKLEQNATPSSRSAPADSKDGGMTYDDWFDHYATS